MWTCKALSAMLLLLVFCLVYPTATSLSVQTNGCPSLVNCTCIESVVRCQGRIPSSVPSSMKEIVLSRIGVEELFSKRFCRVSWNNVRNLTIASVETPRSKVFHLSGDIFDCLNHLAFFKFTSEFLHHFSQYTFTGLANTTVFDLSGCRHISWNDLCKTLSLPENLPKVTHLIISKVGLLEKSVLTIDQSVMEKFSLRPIAFLDLSYTNLDFNFNADGNLCKNLIYLSIAGAQFHYGSTFSRSGPCRSLKTFDNSDDRNLRTVFKDAKCINRTIDLKIKIRFFEAIRIARYNYIVTIKENFEMSNCTWLLFQSYKFLKEFYFTSNYLPNFDSVLKNDRLEVIDLSNNEIENINSDAFKNLTSLTHLVISNNTLSKTYSFETTFSILFKHNQRLKVLDLSNNKLTHLPLNTFISNIQIEKLILSMNYFSQITFNISRMLNLTMLDLRVNAVKSLDSRSQQLLNNLYDKQLQRSNNTQYNPILQVLLEGNPFSCGCESLDFLQWFASTPIFSITRQKFQCRLDAKTIKSTETAIDVAKNNCAMKERKRITKLLSATLLPTCIAAIIISTIIYYKRHKKELIYQRFNDGLQRLRRGGGRFPVFLSYSSEDGDFVKLHILKQLQVFNSGREKKQQQFQPCTALTV